MIFMACCRVVGQNKVDMVLFDDFLLLRKQLRIHKKYVLQVFLEQVWLTLYMT